MRRVGLKTEQPKSLDHSPRGEVDAGLVNDSLLRDAARAADICFCTSTVPAIPVPHWLKDESVRMGPFLETIFRLKSQVWSFVK